MTTLPRDPFLGEPDPVNVLDADHPDPISTARAYHQVQAKNHRTIWQQNAEAFATRPAAYIDQERHVAVERAVQALRDGRPGYALFLMARSVERQGRIAGLGTWPIEPAVPPLWGDR